MNRLFACLVFGVAITASKVALAGATPVADPQVERYDTVRNPRLEAPRFHWGAAIRTQAVFSSGQNLPWVELGGDAVVYPWKHLGLGLTGLMGTPLSASGCETVSEKNCSPYWRTLTPFVEYRLLPSHWLSPYARQSLGIAWGNFSYWGEAPNSTAFVSRTELGLDLHYGASVRPYLTYERLDGPLVNEGGIGGGILVGLTI